MVQELNLSGRFDRVYYTADTALVIDFKTGFSEPDPAQINSQLKILAVLVALHLPTVKEVVVQIISGPYGITEARYKMTDLKAAYDQILATLRAINDPYAPLQPSPEACRYCPAINICQAVKDKIMPTVAMVSPLPEGERAARLLDEVALLQNHLDQIRQYYTQCFLTDPAYQIPGYALVPGAPRRGVKDWPAAIAKLGEFIDQKEIDACAQYSVTALEGLLGKSIGVKGARLKEQFALVLGDLLEAKYPAPTLKRLKGEPKVKALCQASP